MQQTTDFAERARSVLRYDLPASLVVFLVALPLSLGIAVASGAPVLAGIIAAIVGGIVAGALGGSPLQVSGPAAGLTVHLGVGQGLLRLHELLLYLLRLRKQGRHVGCASGLHDWVPLPC